MPFTEKLKIQVFFAVISDHRKQISKNTRFYTLTNLIAAFIRLSWITEPKKGLVHHPVQFLYLWRWWRWVVSGRDEVDPEAQTWCSFPSFTGVVSGEDWNSGRSNASTELSLVKSSASWAKNTGSAVRPSGFHFGSRPALAIYLTCASAPGSASALLRRLHLLNEAEASLAWWTLHRYW